MPDSPANPIPTAQSVGETLTYLTRQIGARPVGSAQEQQAAEYMAEQMARRGLQVQTTSFPAPAWSCEPGFLRWRNDGGWRESACQPVAPGPATPPEGITAPLLHLGAGREQDLRGQPLAGKIGLVFGLGLDRPETLQRLCASGLAAVLFVDPRLPMPWVIHAGVPAGWAELLTIPAATVPYFEAWELSQQTEALVHLNLQTRREPSRSQNVLGVCPARDDSLPPLVLTCHHDSVVLGEGAEDNGTGMAVLLAVARALGACPPLRPVHLLSCGWEESLSEGARLQVAADPARAAQAALVLNVDSVAAWMGRNVVSVVGDESLRRWTEASLDALGFSAEVVTQVSPYSDMYPFNLVGVPSLWFYRPNLGEVRFYHHSAHDTLDKISFDLLAETAAAVLHLIRSLAERPALPFERTLPAEQVEQIEQERRRLFDLPR